MQLAAFIGRFIACRAGIAFIDATKPLWLPASVRRARTRQLFVRFAASSARATESLRRASVAAYQLQLQMRAYNDAHKPTGISG